MQIHEVERDAALQVSVYAADGDLIPDVFYFEVREVRLRVRDRLVNGFVLLDAPEEVPLRVFARRVLVVGVTHTNFQRDVGSDDSRVVADRLEEYEGHPILFGHPSLNRSSAEMLSASADWGTLSRTNLRALVLFVASEWSVRQIPGGTDECDTHHESQHFLHLVAIGSAFPGNPSLVARADESPPHYCD